MANALFTPWKIILFTLGAVFVYCLCIGWERFYYESTGTLILSPSIYVRLLPHPFNRWLLTLVQKESVCFAVTLIPLIILGSAAVMAGFSVRLKSAWLALTASVLVGTVFGVYHYLQPMGMTYVLY